MRRWAERAGQLRNSEVARRSANNAAYSLADYLLSPILMLLATPFLVARLGLQDYGIWMLANAFVGSVGVLNLGLGDATIKYVSTYRAKMDQVGVARVVRSTLTIYVMLGGLVAAVVFFTSPLLVRRVFNIDPQHQMMAIRAFQIAGAGLVVRSIDSVFTAALRGYERYDLAAKVTMSVRVLTIGAAVVLVLLGHGVVAILLASVVAIALGAGVQAVLARRLVPELSFYPTLHRTALREIFSFGLYSWIQAVGGVIFSQVDRLLIAAMLGTREVAYYSVCLQLAQQVHALAAASFHFLFPLTSGTHEGGNREQLRRIYGRCVFVNFVMATVLALPLIVFGQTILRLWMGVDFASHTHALLAILALAFWLLSINVVPHNALLGLGKVRFVAVSNLAGGLFSALGAIGLISLMGLNGAAVGRLLYGPAISLNYIKAARSM